MLTGFNQCLVATRDDGHGFTQLLTQKKAGPFGQALLFPSEPAPQGAVVGGKRPLVAFVRQQSHKASTLDGFSDSMLTDRRATCLPTTENAAVTVNQFFQEVHVFVIDIHRTRTLAVYKQRVFSNGAGLGFCLTAGTG